MRARSMAGCFAPCICRKFCVDFISRIHVTLMLIHLCSGAQSQSVALPFVQPAGKTTLSPRFTRWCQIDICCTWTQIFICCLRQDMAFVLLSSNYFRGQRLHRSPSLSRRLYLSLSLRLHVCLRLYLCLCMRLHLRLHV